MIKSIAIELRFNEISKLVSFAKAQAISLLDKYPEDSERQTELLKMLETCEEIKKLILANESTKFILMDKPY